MFGRVYWTSLACRYGDKVGMIAELCESQETVNFLIYEFDKDGSHELLGSIPATISARLAQALWTVRWVDDTDDVDGIFEARGGLPEFFFEARQGADCASSGMEPTCMLRVEPAKND